MGMASVGIVRAEGQVVTTTASTDLVLLQRRDSTTGQYSPGMITTSNLILTTVGAGLSIVSGANARIGTSTLVAGTVTVANTSITANTRIFLTVQSLGTVTAAKAVSVTAKSNGVSFTITSEDNTDTSVVAWLLVESV